MSKPEVKAMKLKYKIEGKVDEVFDLEKAIFVDIDGGEISVDEFMNGQMRVLRNLKELAEFFMDLDSRVDKLEGESRERLCDL